jgi:phage/plasmid-like protein (TIGR03299 family)
MAHLVETMAYAGETPWHGLGVHVEDDLTVEEMIKAAGLGWGVVKSPMYYDVNGEQINSGKFALLRDSDNQFFDTVSDSWEPCQNRDAFSIFEEFVEAGELEMHTAGSLKGGQIVWGLAKMKEQFALFNDDVTEQYMLLVNPHKFGQGIHVRSTPIRVVCNNTLSWSLGQHSDVQSTQNHRRPFDAEAMKEAIGIARYKFSAYKEAAELLSKKRYNVVSIEEYFAKVFPGYSSKKDEAANDGKAKLSRAAERALEVIETQPGAEFGKGTWWQALNAVTYMADHELGRDADSRLRSAWFGINKDRKNVALQTAIEYAEAA